MNIIFLDIDGVLNTNLNREINPNIVKRLSIFAKSTNSEIILHSGWRFWFGEDMRPLNNAAENLQKVLLREGIVLSGKTPNLSDKNIKKEQTFSKVKAKEILLWLNDHDDIESWLVIDDLDLDNNLVRQHQIQPDLDVGLSDKDIQKTVYFLTNA